MPTRATILRRYWLWRHDRHAYKVLTGDPWTCSCGSLLAQEYDRQAVARRRRPHWAGE